MADAVGVEQAVAVSGERIAAARALEAEYHETPLFVDRMAECLAGEKAMAALRARSTPTNNMSNVTIRTRFFDDFIQAAVEDNSASTEDNIAQVVLLGAGMDTRAWRMPCLNRTEMTVYEVDLDDVLSTKEDRVALFFQTHQDTASLQLNCVRRAVRANLTSSNWGTKLKAAGFSSTAPSLWVLEGLLYYFDEEDVSLMMLSILPLLADGSVVIASILGKEKKPSQQQPRRTDDNLTIHFKWRCPDPITFFHSTGFKVSSCVPLGSPRAHYGRWSRLEYGSVSYVAMQGARDNVSRRFAMDPSPASTQQKNGPTEQEVAMRMPKVLSEQQVAPEHCDIDSVFDGSMITAADATPMDDKDKSEPVESEDDAASEGVCSSRETSHSAEGLVGETQAETQVETESDAVWLERSKFPKCLRMVLKGYTGKGHPLLSGSHPVLGGDEESKALTHQFCNPSGEYVWDVSLPFDFEADSFKYNYMSMVDGLSVQEGETQRSISVGKEKVKVAIDLWQAPQDF